MSLSINDNPTTLVAAKNPAWYKITTDAFITAATLPYLEFNFTGDGVTADAEPFSITIDGITISMQSDSLGATGLFVYPVNTGTSDPLDMAVWVDDFVAALKANHQITAYFDIEETVAGTTVRLTSKLGKSFSYTESMTNTTITDSATYTAISKADNFSVKAELWVERGDELNDFKLATTYAQVPDDSQVVYFDVSRELQAFMDHVLPSVDLAEPDVEVASALICRFYLKYVEHYGSPPVDDTWAAEVEPITAILAGLPMQDGTPDLATELGGATPKFLTWQPRKKRVSESSLEFLYLINWETADQKPIVEVKAYFEDGTTSTSNQIASLSAHLISQHQVWIIPTGFTQLDVANIDAAKTVSKYEVTVQLDPAATRSETFTYILDRISYPNEQTFLLPNSLGGYDTVRVLSSTTNEMERPSSRAKSAIPYNHTTAQVEHQQLPGEQRNRYTDTIGPLTASQALWIQDLLRMHGQPYSLWEGAWAPINILADSVQIEDENSDLQLISFEWEWSMAQKNTKA